MDFSKRHFKRRPEHREYARRLSGDNHNYHPHPPVNPESTGAEAEYFRSLIDSHTKVTVVLTDGEQLQGYIRYYDRDCFSLGITAEGPRFLLRKDSVAYIAEE